MSDVRAPIRLAINSLKCDPLMNMGDCMELFALAQTTDEAALLKQAYVDALVLDTKLTREAAAKRATENLGFGISYMGKEEIAPLYFPQHDGTPQAPVAPGK